MREQTPWTRAERALGRTWPAQGDRPSPSSGGVPLIERVKYRWPSTEGARTGREERKAELAWGTGGPQHRGALERHDEVCGHGISRRDLLRAFWSPSFCFWPLLETNIPTTGCPLL